jgi:TPR repeat protein
MGDVMKSIGLGVVLLLLASLAHGDGEALDKQGAAVYASDPAKAFGLFVQAAEAGNPSAMAGAGHCCETGTGTDVDYAKAIEWYEKAVAHNSLKACEGLARIYASCDDPEFHDGKKAVKYATAINRKKSHDPESLALLAAAYARNIEFGKAVEAGTKAVRNAKSPDAAKELRVRAEKYKAGEPLPEKATAVWISRAAEMDALWAVLQQANFYFNAGNLDEAYTCYCAVSKQYPGRIEVSKRRYLKQSRDQVFLAAEQYEKGSKTIVKQRIARDGSVYPVKQHSKYDKEIGYTYSCGCDGVMCDMCYSISGTVTQHPPNIPYAYFLYKVAAKKGHAGAKRRLKAMERKCAS